MHTVLYVTFHVFVFVFQSNILMYSSLALHREIEENEIASLYSHGDDHDADADRTIRSNSVDVI